MNEVKDPRNSIGYSRRFRRDMLRNNINSANRDLHRYRRRAQPSPVFDWGKSEYVPAHEFVRRVIKSCGGKNLDAYFKLRDRDCALAGVVMPEIRNALTARQDKFDSNLWHSVVWGCQDWADAPFARLHCVHVSEHDKSQVAYTPDERSLLADKQVRTKPGRYLMKFYGPDSDNPVLTEAECKMWAEKHAAAQAPAELKFVLNTDPDGWEWVYENSPESCMRYNRGSRYLNHGLYGQDHPVRAYAHPENELALAYIMVPGATEDRDSNCPPGEYVVSCRTIVNTKDKTWLRMYYVNSQHRQALTDLLEEQGYNQNNATLDGQQLVRRETGDEDIICPYLDGYAQEIAVSDDYLRVVRSGDYGGCNSSGVIECAPRCTCDECGARCDEDDLTYVDCADQHLCESCRDDQFEYGYVDRHHQDWMRNGEANLYDGTYYHDDCLSDHDLYRCDVCGEVNHIDNMVSLEDSGEMVCDHHCGYCDVKEEHFLSSDLRATEYDGTIHEDIAVRGIDNHWHYVEKCYRLNINGAPVYIHMEDMECASITNRLSQACGVLMLSGGAPITAPFEPINLTFGDDVNYSDAIELMTDAWGLEGVNPDDVPEFIGPMLTSNQENEVRV